MSLPSRDTPQADASNASGMRADALLDAQRQVLEMIVRGRALREVLVTLCRIVEEQAGRPVHAAILLVDADGRRLITGAAPSLPEAYSAAIDGIEIAPNVGTCCAAAALGEPVITLDFASDPAWELLRHLPLEIGLRAAWSMPISSSAGKVLGTFGTYFPEPRAPLAHERRLVEVLAHTAALAIERQNADEQLRQNAARSHFLSELAAATQPLVEAADVMATSARLLAEHLDVERCAYAEVEDEQVFVITGDHSRGVPSIVGRWPVAAFGTRCVSDMQAGRAYVVHDVEADPGIGPADLEAYRATNIRAVICVPLHKDDKLTAAMAVHQTTPRRWSNDEIELVTLVVGRCWEALERARVTRSLRDSEARYRTMVEASPECVALIDQDGTLLQVNAAGLRMIEAPAEEAALGRSFFDVIVPEYHERFRAFNDRVCRGQGGTLDFEIIGMGGTRRAMESTAVPLLAPSGGYAQLSVTRDITARAAADRALAESRARLDYAVRLSGVGFWYCDLPFDELIWDGRVKEHFFIPLDARVTIDDFYARIHPDDREPTRRAIETSIREHASYDVVYRTVDPESGAVKHIRALGGTAYGADGAPTRFDGVTVDVTAHKRDQEQLARALERERAQGRLLEKVAEAALTIHATSSVDSVLRVVTEEARTLIGANQSVTSLTVSSDWSQAIHHVSSSEKSARACEPARGAASLYAAVCQTNRPLRLSRAERAAHPAWRDAPGADEHAPVAGGWLGVPFVGRSGQNLGLVQLSDKQAGEFTETDEAILTQLAQIAAVALENARLYDQLREQDRRKDEFLATLAHELRNPLAPIRTGLQVVRLAGDSLQARKAHDMMERQLGHMVRMVDDLLDVSRITLGKVTLKKERVDLRSAVHSALETTRPLVDAAKHEVHVELPDTPLMLEADPTRLAQIVANLVNNAAKYTPPAGRITLTSAAEAGWAVLRVTDTGEGIPAEMLPKVFEMFTQVGHSIERSQGGLGIGLTLVQRLVELHGGAIEAHSAGLGRGSTFTVRLPVAPQLQAGSLTSESGQSPAKAESRLRVLVVDDNVDAAESLAMLLELSGHEARMAHTGPDALAEAAAFRPQLMLLDIGLPGLNGYEVAKRIRADASLAQPVLVALTGWGTEEDRRQALAAGFDRHLVKPFDASKIADVLSAARSKGSGAPP